MSDVRSLQFPRVTGVLLCGVALVTLPVLGGLLPFTLISLRWARVFSSLQIWRPLTSFFFGGGGIKFIFDVFLLYRTSSALEADILLDTASYTWTLIVLASMILSSTAFFQFSVLFKPMLSALLYLWSKQNATSNISLFGLISVPARLYPAVLIVLDFVQSGPNAALGGIVGTLAGHAWWFISVYLPLYAPARLRRPNPLPVPMAFRRLFVQRSIGSGASGTRPAVRLGQGVEAINPRERSEAADAVRHRWGSGQRLGGSSL